MTPQLRQIFTDISIASLMLDCYSLRRIIEWLYLYRYDILHTFRKFMGDDFDLDAFESESSYALGLAEITYRRVLDVKYA